MAIPDKTGDKQFREWIQKQPCAICKGFAEYIHGEGRNHAAHVRRARNSGIAIKPLFSCIPLCFDCHSTQHKQGEWVLLANIRSSKDSFEVREWFKAKADQYLNQWRSL